jgi:hypothetical protein
MTAVLDSQSTILRSGKSYVTSESRDPENRWGQPPASYYVFQIKDELIEGVYIILHPDKVTPVWGDPLLQQEMEAWEAASDEDLARFESNLD